VIDRYAEVLVMKLYTAAWAPWLADLRSALAEVCPADCLVLRLSRDVQRRPEFLCGLEDGAVLAGAWLSGPVQFSENGLRFEADVLRGQKTGFFFDQRDNRARAGKLAAGKRTLNVFAYTGGFSLYAARGGAPEVLSIDSSAPALDAAERNFALNRSLLAVATCRHTTLAADAFDALADLRGRGERFELVIVDPPAFAKRDDEVPAALHSYGRLTELALGVLAPGGRLVMASCSSRVSAPDFFATVNRAAAQVARPLAEIDRTGHAIDHPIRFPEGAYLKCLFAIAP
jgi:23S rRNA (cytosine1962-C5)-methyltransferase